MSVRRTPADVEDRLREVRRQLRDRHAGVEPDAHFAARVMARLPRHAEWSIGWAAFRVVPVALAVAMALMIALMATGRVSNGTTASAAVTSAAPSGSDPLEWLLEGGGERR